MRENRIRVPKEAAAGEIVEVRAMIIHPMETGFNVDDQGAVIPVNIVTDFRCVYDGREVFRARLEPGTLGQSDLHLPPQGDAHRPGRVPVA